MKNLEFGNESKIYQHNIINEDISSYTDNLNE